jgi:hypothetical protein
VPNVALCNESRFVKRYVRISIAPSGQVSARRHARSTARSPQPGDDHEHLHTQPCGRHGSRRTASGRRRRPSGERPPDVLGHVVVPEADGIGVAQGRARTSALVQTPMPGSDWSFRSAVAEVVRHDPLERSRTRGRRHERAGTRRIDVEVEPLPARDRPPRPPGPAGGRGPAPPPAPARRGAGPATEPGERLLSGHLLLKTAGSRASKTRPVRPIRRCGKRRCASTSTGWRGSKPLGSSSAPSIAGIASSAHGAPGPHARASTSPRAGRAVTAGGPDRPAYGSRASGCRPRSVRRVPGSPARRAQHLPDRARPRWAPGALRSPSWRNLPNTYVTVCCNFAYAEPA